MQIVFSDQYINMFLLLNGLVILFYYGARIKSKNRSMKFGNFETLEKITDDSLIKSSDISLFLRLAGFSLIIIGLSGPVLVNEIPAVSSAYTVALDSSGTMTASDIEPTRLEAAKDISSNFVNSLPEETETGLVVYSGGIDKQQRLTQDKDEVISSISNVTLGKAAGTATGDAVITGSSILEESDNTRELILITDGRQNVGASINESVEFAQRRNVTVNTIGLGSDEEQEEEETVEIDGVEGELNAFPNLEEENLYQLSNETGGSFSIVTDREEFETAFDEINTEEVETDISAELIFIGLFLLLMEWIFNITKYRVLP